MAEENTFVQYELVKLDQLIEKHWPKPAWERSLLADRCVWVSCVRDLVRKGALDVTQAIIADTRDVDIPELCHIALCGREVGISAPGSRGVFVGPNAIESECHASAVIHFLAAPEHWQIWSGFADGHNFHSWLVHESGNTLLEPTPMIRGKYFGAPVSDAVACVKGERENIIRLHLADKIDDQLYKRTMRALDAFVEKHTS